MVRAARFPNVRSDGSYLGEGLTGATRTIEIEEVTADALDRYCDNYHIGRATFMESIGFGYPVRKDGQIDGIVLAPIDLDKLDERLAANELPDGAELVVIDSAGTVVAQLPDPARWTGTPAADVPLVEQMLTRETGDGTLAGVDGTTRAYSWRTVEGSAGNLRVAVGVPG